jgi:hypothetical protein
MGADYTAPAWWYGGVPSNYVTSEQLMSNGVIYQGDYLQFSSAQLNCRANANFMSGSYYGLKAECEANNSGGLRAYNFTNNQATNIRMSTSEVTITANGVATQTVSGLVPAGCLVVGITARVTTAIGGATTFGVEDVAGTPIKWLTGVAVALGSTGDLSKSDPTTCPGPKIYAAASNLTIRGDANFNATGKVRLTVHYLTLTAPTS